MIVKSLKTLKIKTNNKLVPGKFFFYFDLSAKTSEHLTNTLKIPGNYVICGSSKCIFLFVIHETKVIHAIASSFFLQFCWFLPKNANIIKMLGHIFLKLFMVVKLQTKFKDYTKKMKKGIFYSHLLHRKTVNLEEATRVYLCTFLKCLNFVKQPVLRDPLCSFQEKLSNVSMNTIRLCFP